MIIDAHQLLRDLFAAQPLAVLATRSHSGAYANIVAITVLEDLSAVLFATTRATRNYENLAAHPAVAFLIDNRSNTVSDFRDAIAVTALGKARPVAGRDRLLFQGPYRARHPHRVDFLLSPTTVLFRADIERYSIVHHFQQVIEVVVDGENPPSP
ncbi:MAG TPA: pyridoxamine 5'-phosphate oxidase family protein [Methanoculleus sp.]|nr:pyridoxamine 5'-phosphate oxidase family protein [Methanoculleus sp.]